MTKVLFVCLGNICRSPMAEFVFRNMVAKRGIADDFYIASAATSNEALGCNVHHGTQNILREKNIPFTDRYATKITAADYHKYDYIICMDSMNMRDMKRIFGGDADGKLYKLLDFTDNPRDVADPWYTGNFDVTYSDICKGCEGFLEKIGY